MDGWIVIIIIIIIIIIIVILFYPFERHDGVTYFPHCTRASVTRCLPPPIGPHPRHRVIARGPRGKGPNHPLLQGTHG